MTPGARRVLYVQYTNPGAYPPVEHSAHLLADAGWDVLMLGTARAGDTLKIADHERISVCLQPFVAGGWRQKLHYVMFAAWVSAHARRWRPDWIYASDPLSCAAALGAKVTSGARLVYHEHDSPIEATGNRSLFRVAVKAARREIAARAELCILPNIERARLFHVTHPRSNVLTVWNCPTRAEVAEAPRAVSTGGLRILYHGSIVPARLPLAIIDALALLPPTVTLSIVGYQTIGHPDFVAQLTNRARTRGVEHRVEFMGAMKHRRDVLRHCGTCDVGLALMPLTSSDPNERAMLGASNKPFDYMACGLALVVSDLPDWRSTFVDGGFGLACDPESPESVAAVLLKMFDDPELRHAMGERGRQAILADWNYDARFAPVLSHLTAADVSAVPARVHAEPARPQPRAFR